jgi:hypothetical protein
MHQSEIAQLRERITEEYEAMKQGLTGLAWGNAKHNFIDVRMKRVDHYREQLVNYVGERDADFAICDLYTKVMG